MGLLTLPHLAKVRVTNGYQRPHLRATICRPKSAHHSSSFVIIGRQGGGPQRPTSRPGDTRDGSGRGRDGGERGRGAPPSPRAESLVLFNKAADWWKQNVFKGARLGPVEPRKLANGHAARPGLGSIGKEIEVITNHVLLSTRNVPQVAQYEVKILRLPAGANPEAAASTGAKEEGGDKSEGPGSRSREASGASSAGSGGRRGGGGKRPAARIKVVDSEARDVLSYYLDTTAAGEESPAKNAWAYDGGALLYTVLREQLMEVAGAQVGGEGGAVRQPGDSEILEIPAAAGGLAAGHRYEVLLRRVGMLDPKTILLDAQKRRQVVMAAGTGAAMAAETEPSDATEAPVASDAAARQQPSGGTSDQALLALLDLAIREEVARDPDSVRVGPGSFVSYKQEDKSVPMGGAGTLPLKVLNGFRSVVSLVAAGPTLALDTATAVVAEDGPLLRQLETTFNARGKALAEELRKPSNVAKLQAALAGLEVKNRCTGFTMKLSGKLSAKSARDYKFKNTVTGQQESVEDYFKAKYNVTLQHPDLPCATARKDAQLPLELLDVVRSQKRMSRLSDRDKAALIKAAAKRPADRLRAIKDALRGPLRGLSGEVARRFGLAAAATDLLKVPARLLPGPLLETRDVSKGQGTPGGLEPGNAGEWRAPGVAAPGVWTSGAVLSFLDSNVDKGFVDKLVAQLGSSLHQLGAAPMPASLPVVWASPPRSGANPDTLVRQCLQRAVKKAQDQYGRRPQLVLVVMPGKGLYDYVKAAGDGELGLVTQCIDSFKAGKAKGGPPPAYTFQLALSVNAKVGGTNHRLAGPPQAWAPSLGGRRLMVLGADVSRGAAGAMAGLGGGGAGSEAEVDPAAGAGVEYAAVIGSVDSHCVRYHQRLSCQVAGNRDIVVGLRDSVMGLIRGYAAAEDRGRDQQLPPAGQPPGVPLPAASLPEVVLMFRDGVSDSMLDTVLAQEYPAIVEACRAVGGPSYRPKITFVVVQKSHNTRFFPAKPADEHRSGNVRPGTVVEEEVVDDVAFQFFLNSHAGIQGTNRAPRYTVLVDEWGFTEDGLQSLIFGLCHTYPACNRSLSLPPSARLADRAADRARTAFRDKVSRPQAGGVWYELLEAPEEAHYVL